MGGAGRYGTVSLRGEWPERSVTWASHVHGATGMWRRGSIAAHEGRPLGLVTLNFHSQLAATRAPPRHSLLLSTFNMASQR